LHVVGSGFRSCLLVEEGLIPKTGFGKKKPGEAPGGPKAGFSVV